MNKEEALKFFNGIELKFISYFKYCFTYEGEKEGLKLRVVYGGEADNIYKRNLGNEEVFENEDFEYFAISKNGKGEDVYIFEE